MANYDNQMAERVWQRVRVSGEQEKLNLRGMIQEELAAAAAYRQLARQLGNWQGEMLQQLIRDAQNHADCLLGIQRLTTSEHVPVKPPQPVQERPDLLLRKCYAGALKRMGAYDGLSGHGEYGHVFAALAARERENSCRILELLGKIK